MNVVARKPTVDYQVADITLADWGRKSPSPKPEMPGLMAVRRNTETAAARGRLYRRLAA